MVTRFLDQAGLIALWGKIKDYIADYHSNHLPTIGNKALKFKTNNSLATVVTMNEDTNDKTLEINGDSTWITSGALDLTTSNTVKATFSHAAPDSSSMSSRTYTSSTGNYAFGTEYTVIASAALDADDKGHVNIGTSSTNPGLTLTKQKIKDTNRAIKVDGSEKLASNVNTAVDFVDGTGTDAVWTSTGSKIQYNIKEATASVLGGVKITNKDSNLTLSSSNASLDGSTTDRYYGVQVDNNGVAFVNVPWPNQVSALNAKLKVAADSGTAAQIFSANAENDSTVTIAGGTNLNTSVNGTTLTVNHDTMNSNSSPMATAVVSSGAGANTSSVSTGCNVLSGVSLAHTNGHITGVTSTYTTLTAATQSSAGLMSAADKTAIDNLSQTIATALTSAITPKGSITAEDLVAALENQDNNPLSQSHIGYLYNLSTPLVIGNTITGDTSTFYSNFVEGGNLTANGSDRFVIQAGQNLLVVNTGTAQNPSYKFDIISGMMDLSGYVEKSDIGRIFLNAEDSGVTYSSSNIEGTFNIQDGLT